jgi:glucose/arabinose dehydrogenase
VAGHLRLDPSTASRAGKRHALRRLQNNLNSRGDGFPEKYRGGAFVGEHGSWDRDRLNGYKVIFVPISGGHPNGKAEDVATDFLNSKEEARGRPVGLAVDKSGALLIADDVGNTVWRVTSSEK